MPGLTLDVLYRCANVLVAAVAFIVAALIVVEVRRRPARRREPLGVVLAVLLIAVGLRAAVRVNDSFGMARADLNLTVVVIDWISACAMLALLALRRRYPLFVETAEIMREYETGYAEKAREARTLAQINEELRRLDELKSQFLAMVSHELRTPLTAIIGYSRLLIRQVHGTLTGKQLEQQEAIFRGAMRLSDLINDLLDASRLEAGRVEVHARPTDVRQTADQVIAVVRAAAHAKQIRLTNDLAGDLPPVLADPSRLHQILANLVSNAVKVTRPGGSVRVSGGAQNEQVWIAVEDTGVGIARDELARIWEAFYQVESPMRRGHGGSGLGLAIVRRLVELHGGVVRA